MDPASIAAGLALAEGALQLVTQVAAAYQQIRTTLSTTDQATLDAQYANVIAQSNKVAAQLQAIPDDPA